MTLAPIEVEAERQVAPVLSTTRIEPEVLDAPTTDTAALLQGQPGAAVVRNGPQTGIVQLRGLHNERVRVRVDGMAITPACPNHMDPPLHFLLPSDVEELEVTPGAASVSQGGDSIAGAVAAVSTRPRLADTAEFRPVFDTHFRFRGADNGIDTGASLGAADDRTSVAYRYQYLEGDNLRFAGGKVRDTGYESQDHSLRLRRLIERGLVDLDVGFFDGDHAGTPALPMDIVKDEAVRTNLALERRLGAGLLRTRAYVHAIDHRMDNFSLRPAGAMSMMRMFSPADTQDVGVTGSFEMARPSGLWRLGSEVFTNAHDAYQVNAGNGMRQDIFHDTSRTRLGLYGEWERAVFERWTLALGVRGDTIWADAGDIDEFYMPAAADAQAFNAAGHSRVNQHVDATASVRWDATDTWSFELSASRKTRSPSTLERYLWTPLAASAGQADGRTYLGSLTLDPEVSHQASLATMWQWGTLSAQQAVFYNRVHDYIQGAPIDRVDQNGLPVLQYTNLEAELYGADGGVTWTPATGWELGGLLGYVRGRNLDLDDNLYRIAPLSARLYAQYAKGRWQHRVEGYVSAAQHRVSRTNGEPQTDSYGLLHLRTAFEALPGLQVTAGIENVLDNRYADHLSGINRVMDSDVAVGQRLPGAGRFVYVGFEYAR